MATARASSPTLKPAGKRTHDDVIMHSVQQHSDLHPGDPLRNTELAIHSTSTRPHLRLQQADYQTERGQAGRSAGVDPGHGDDSTAAEGHGRLVERDRARWPGAGRRGDLGPGSEPPVR